MHRFFVHPLDGARHIKVTPDECKARYEMLVKEIARLNGSEVNPDVAAADKTYTGRRVGRAS